MLENFTVLIVEDEAHYYKPMEKYLIESNFQVIAITSLVQEAKKLFKLHSPNAIILDLQLKDGNGTEIIDHLSSIKDLKSKPYIIVATAFTNDQVLQTLKTHKYFYYDKNDKNYHPKLIVEHLSFIMKTNSEQNFFSKPVEQNPIEINTSTNSLLAQIDQELQPYNINPKRQAKVYLVNVIHEIIEEDLKKIVLETFYKQIAIEAGDMNFNSVNVSIRRLLHEIFTGPDKVAAYCHYHGVGEHELKNLKEFKVPSNREFVLHIVKKVQNRMG